jgi:ABC-type glycerol-3-phosphate transport system permease component
MNASIRKKTNSIIILIVLLFYLLIVIFPYFWTFLASVKDAAAINHPLDFDFTPTLANWKAVISAGIPRQALNSLIVGLITVSICLVAGAPAAYAFSRFNGGNRKRFLVLLAQMLPPATLIIRFSCHGMVNINNSIMRVVISHLTVLLPLVTWFLIGFLTMYRVIEEAALVDGCTHWQTFLMIVIPVVRPGLGAAGLFCLVLSWNDMFYALILTSVKARTYQWELPGIGPSVCRDGANVCCHHLAILPMILLSFFVQRFMLRYGVEREGLALRVCNV